MGKITPRLQRLLEAPKLGATGLVLSLALIACNSTPGVPATAGLQRVLPNGTYVMVNVNSGKVMSVVNAATDNGARLHQWTNTDAPDQKWKFEDTGDGSYKIINAFSNKAMDVSGGSAANGAPLQLWDYGSGTNQRFTLSDVGNGAYSIKAVHSGRVIEVSNFSTSDGGVAQQWDWADVDSQKWRLVSVPNSSLTPIPKPLVVYDDTLASGWQDWSWNSNVNFGAGAPVRSGSKAILVSLGAWGGLSLRSAQVVNSSGFDSLSFAVYGAPGGSSLRVGFNTEDTSGPTPFVSVSTPEGVWTQVVVPLRDVGSPRQIKRVNITDGSGRAQGPVGIDDLKFVSVNSTPTPLPQPTPTPTPPPPSSSLPFSRGVNLAGADFGESIMPGVFGVQYTYPNQGEVDYFNAKGMTIYRLPFLWERLQRALNADFNSDELARLDAFVTATTAKGKIVILDPHNYARYYGNLIGSSQVPNAAFADFWTRLAAHYKSNPRVVFGLMNEPHNMPTAQWVSAANAAIAAIRATGASNTIFVPGNRWTGAWTWFSQDGDGPSNADALLNIADSGNNLVFEVHQYLDIYASGTEDPCVSATIGSERLKAFTGWLRDHGRKGFLGEFSSGKNTTCDAALDDMLRYVEANKDVWNGWTYWAAGPWWSPGTSLEPSNGQDARQMPILEKFLKPAK